MAAGADADRDDGGRPRTLGPCSETASQHEAGRDPDSTTDAGRWRCHHQTPVSELASYAMLGGEHRTRIEAPPCIQWMIPLPPHALRISTAKKRACAWANGCKIRDGHAGGG